MNYTDIAKMLNGRPYRDEVTNEIKELAKQDNIVIIYGASDDLMELDGALYDEFGCYDGGTAYLNYDGLFEDCEENCKYSQQIKKQCKTIEAVWCDENNGFTWSYKTDIPHATFEIYDDEEKYCQGICFDRNELKENK